MMSDLIHYPINARSALKNNNTSKNFCEGFTANRDTLTKPEMNFSIFRPTISNSLQAYPVDQSGCLQT